MEGAERTLIELLNAISFPFSPRGLLILYFGTIRREERRRDYGKGERGKGGRGEKRRRE